MRVGLWIWLNMDKLWQVMANDQCKRHQNGGSAWLERDRGRGREWALLRSDHVERMICQMLLKSWSEPFANYWLCSQIQLRCLCRLHCQSHLHHWNLHRWGLHRCLWKLNHSGKIWRYDFLMKVGLWIWFNMGKWRHKWWQMIANDGANDGKWWQTMASDGKW